MYLQEERRLEMFNNEPLVSICCLTYNHESFVRRAFDSFLMQKVDFEYEILIHDDASTDSTQEIIKEYCNLYPNLFKPILQTVNQHLKNVPIPVQFQFPRVKGKYIAFCEGDDYWVDSYKLSKQVNFLETNKEYIGTAHQCLIVDEKDTLIARYSPTYLQLYKKGKVFTYKDAEKYKMPGQTATLVFRNSAILNYKLSDWTSSLYDFSLVAFLSLQGDIYVFPEIMSAYRRVTKTGLSYSKRNNYKTDYSAYFVRGEIENKSLNVFGRQFKYYCKNINYITDAIKNYAYTGSIDELNFVFKLYNTENKFLLFIKFPFYILIRITQKIKYMILNYIFSISFRWIKKNKI